MAVERAPAVWINAPRPAFGSPAKEGDDAVDMPVRTLVQMDAPDHTTYRKISVDWFKQANIARLSDRAAELAKRSVDHMADLGGECDFFTDVAMNYPLYIILALLGLPEEDFPRMLKLTQEMFGKDDPELASDTEGDRLMANLLEFFEYFQGLIEDRRANPRDDLASVIANAEVDGEPIGVLEAVGYYVIIATAGHDTTSAAIGGGLAALLAHPDQLRLLMDDPALVPTAVEEMFRYVSPVKQFMRTATSEQVVGGVTIPEGGAVLMSFPSANRDEDVFARPGTVRRRSRPEPAHRVRVRRPLLPRDPSRPPRDARVLQRADPAARARRARRRARVHADRSSSAAPSTSRFATACADAATDDLTASCSCPCTERQNRQGGPPLLVGRVFGCWVSGPPGGQ